MAGDSGKRKIVPHHKVRTGCETCKRRRVKCDEVRPACSNCSLVGRKCIYHHVLPSYPVFSPADYLDRSTIRFSTRDMELLHHWTSATAFTIGGTDDLRVMMRDKLPIEGFAKPYLLHLILAVSSLHLAYLKPNENTVYSTLARHHYSAALPLFRANLQFMDETNCHALYGSSQLLAKYALACEKRPQRLLLSPILDSSAQTDWLMLIRGAYSIRDSHSQILRRGPMSCTASDCWNGVSDNVESPYKENLERVTSLINGSYSKYYATSSPMRLMEIGLLLRKLSSQQPSQEYPWIFFALLAQRRADAVFIFAHFCIILEKMNDDSVWYMRNWSRTLFDECLRCLDDYWLPHLAWPLSTISGED
ncbi:hypothetical protein EV356DRAFT_511137 [Viridothelium virens]|uniref:Zn(2)-C6 fungal-type domain-containing protein n=1 Tax=Viridothelium virens TaxID=1048519 RepID=A0A6A6HPN4_VIRVR|nr:hypothetical protein EV356DRAFT_511137 [Viridothelium virens]